MTERVPAITGLGLISSLAPSVQGHWRRVLELATGIRQVAGEDVPRALRYAGRVDDDGLPPDMPAEVLKQGRLISAGSRLALRAVAEAMHGSGLDVLQIPPARKALYIGASDDSKSDYQDFYQAFREAGVSPDRAIDAEHVNRATLHAVNPFFLLEGLTNNLVAFVSRRYQLQGPNTTLASHSPCGAQALDLACRSLLQDEADVAIVVGLCVWSRFVPLFDLDALRLLSQCRDGSTSFRPFDERRDGFIAGDGAAALVLEPLGRARARGARVFGCVRGLAGFTDGSETRNLGVSVETTRRAMTAALDEAGARPEEIAFVSPHGIGTQEGDRVELSAIAELLGDNRAVIPISAMKPYTGHMGAASDIAEIALALIGLENGLAPATPNFRTADAEFEDIDIVAQHRRITARYAVSISQGFGGQSLATVVSAGPGPD
jgi:3-oxoacyl-[acyl-carrier-protein] synthase II